MAQGDNIVLSSLDSQNLRTLIGTRATSSGALAIGTTASKGNIAAAVQYCIAGVSYVKAITADAIVFAATDGNIADGSYRIYMISLNAAGTVATTPAAADDSNIFPDVPAGYCPIGAIKIATAGAVFIPSTTLLSAGTVTDTYTNYAVLPDDDYA